MLPIFKHLQSPSTSFCQRICLSYDRYSNDLNIETEWTETVIATNHGTHRVFHPSIVKIAHSFGQRLDELPHGIPCRRTHPIGTFSIDGNPLLALLYVAGMLNGIFVSGHQVRVNRLPYCCNPYLIHTNWNYIFLRKEVILCLRIVLPDGADLGAGWGHCSILTRVSRSFPAAPGHRSSWRYLRHIFRSQARRWLYVVSSLSAITKDQKC